MNQQTYNALPGLNHSGMKWLEKSPAHYQTWKQGKNIESSHVCGMYQRQNHHDDSSGYLRFSFTGGEDSLLEAGIASGE